jgi:AbrB family looped-hinge helix DNA binding protein
MKLHLGVRLLGQEDAMIEQVSRMTSKGQVTIPQKIRQHLGIGPADKVAFVIADDGQVVVRPARFTVASVRGSVPALPGTTTEDFDRQIREAFEDAAEEKVRELQGRADR